MRFRVIRGRKIQGLWSHLFKKKKTITSVSPLFIATMLAGHQKWFNILIHKEDWKSSTSCRETVPLIIIRPNRIKRSYCLTCLILLGRALLNRVMSSLEVWTDHLQSYNILIISVEGPSGPIKRTELSNIYTVGQSLWWFSPLGQLINRCSSILII